MPIWLNLADKLNGGSNENDFQFARRQRKLIIITKTRFYIMKSVTNPGLISLSFS